MLSSGYVFRRSKDPEVLDVSMILFCLFIILIIIIIIIIIIIK